MQEQQELHSEPELRFLKAASPLPPGCEDCHCCLYSFTQDFLLSLVKWPNKGPLQKVPKKLLFSRCLVIRTRNSSKGKRKFISRLSIQAVKYCSINVGGCRKAILKHFKDRLENISQKRLGIADPHEGGRATCATLANIQPLWTQGYFSDGQDSSHSAPRLT